jgi:hypothetical protein
MPPTIPVQKRPYLEENYVPEYPDWDRGTCLIIGGGPSLNDMDWDEIRGWQFGGANRYTIAVNEAMLTLCPHADIGYWVDARWYQWNRLRMHESKVRKRYTSAHGLSVDYGGGTYVENRNNAGMFSTNPKYVCGRDSGGIAINIAYHCNAAKVYLIGFDMWDNPAGEDTGNFHDMHQNKQPGTPRSSHFIPAHAMAAKTIIDKNLNFVVHNATPYSALKCWPPAIWSRIQ